MDGSDLDSSGHTALDVATASDAHVDCVQALLGSRGVRAGRRDGQGTTALWRAVRQGRPNVARALVAHDPALVNDARTSDRTSPLWIAARFGYIDMARTLLDSGVVDLDARDLEQGATPLHMAVVYSSKGEDRLVRLLIAAGARIDVVNRAGVSILQAALRRPSGDMVDTILSGTGTAEAVMLRALRVGLSSPVWISLRSDPATRAATYDRDIVITASQCGSLVSVDFLVTQQQFAVDVHRAWDGCTALHAAVIGEHAGLVQHLIVRHRVDTSARDGAGMSPLYHAARRGLLDIVSCIVALAPHCVSVATPEGSTPVVTAARRGHLDVVRVLLDGGADPSAVDAEGCTVLMGAAMMGRADVVELLLHRAANVTAVDARGRGALAVAVGNDVVTHLRRALSLIVLYRGRFEVQLDVSLGNNVCGDTPSGSTVIRGTSSIVILARDTHAGGVAVAIKLCRDVAARDNTVRMLTLLRSVHVAPLVEAGMAFEDHDAFPDTPYAVVMSAGGATLQSTLDAEARLETRRLENDTRALFEGLACSVRHLHDHGVVHGDLKAGNCVRFPPDGRLRLIDFDEARLLGERSPAGKTTPEICPPEMARALGAPDHPLPAAGKGSDMWALGCLLFHLIAGESFVSQVLVHHGDPGHEEGRERALRALAALDTTAVAVVLAPLAARGGTMMCAHALSLMRRLLEPDPARRCRMEGLFDHAFIRGGLTVSMHDQGLAGLHTGQATLRVRQEVAIDLISEVLDGVRRLEDRTLHMLDLHEELRASFVALGGRIGGLRDVLVALADLGCPTTFVIVPDTPPRQWCARRVTAAVVAGTSDVQALATSWVDGLIDVFAESGAVARLVERFSHQRFRLKLVCDKCPTLCEPGYLIEKASPALAKLLPALQVSLKVLLVLNVGMCIARCFFPVVPVLPDGFSKRFEGMLATIGAKNSAAKFALISEAVDAVSASTEGRVVASTQDRRSGKVASKGADGNDTQAKSVKASAHQLKAFLKAQDPTNTWGGLTRVVLAESEGTRDAPVVWCCSHCVQAHGRPPRIAAGKGKAKGRSDEEGSLDELLEVAEAFVQGESVDEAALEGAENMGGWLCFGVGAWAAKKVPWLRLRL